MRKLRIAALGLLFGWCVNLPTGADAAPAFPHALAVGSAYGDILLVQYGGGRDDDDDDRPQRNNNNGGYQQPYQQPYQQQHRNNNNNNFNNGAAAAGAIIGIIGGIAQEQQRQKALRQQQQQYNDRLRTEKNKRNRDAQRARERETIRRNEKNKEEAREKEQQREQAAKDEELKKLKEQVQEQKKQREIEEATSHEDDKYRESNQQDDDVDYEKKNGTVIKIHPSKNGMPDPNNLPNLVVGPTKLPACGYVNLPPDRNLCSGSTDGGSWLRIVTVPMPGGGSSQACVQFSRECKPRLVMIPQPPQYNPVPPPPIPVPPVVCSYPSCAPTPVPPPACTGPSCGEQPDRACTNPPCITPSVVTPKPAEQKQTYPTHKTDKAITVVQKEEEKPVTPPTRTDKAITVVQKEEERPVTPPTRTDKAITVVQKEEKKPVTLPTKTDKAIAVVEKKPAGEPQKTADSDRKDKGGELDDATIPCFSDPTACQILKQQQQQAEQKKQELEKKLADQNPARPEPAWCAGRMDYRTCLGMEDARNEMKKEADEEKYKKEHPDEWAMQHPGPTDSKGCTADGDKPIAALLADPDYRGLLDNVAEAASFHAPGTSKVRDVVTSVVSGIPASATEGVPVGAILGGLTKFIWKDTANDELFNQMKDYVDKLVPDSINNERVTQLALDLQGLRNDLARYVNETGDGEKKTNLGTLLSSLGHIQPKVLYDQTPPEKVMALVVAVGTLHLQALREKYLRDRELYGPNANLDWDLGQYNKAVDDYTTAADTIKQKIIKNRLDQFGEDEDKKCFSTGVASVCDPYYWVYDKFCDWQTPHYSRADKDSRWPQLAARKEQVRKVYNRDLDELLKPIKHWPSLTPVARSTDEYGRPEAQVDAATDDTTPPVKTDKATAVESKRSELLPAASR